MTSTRFRKCILLIVFLTATQFAFAQNNNPLHLNFSTERKNDSVVYLVVKATLQKGFFLFSAKPLNTDDAFISQLNLDSNSSKYLSDTSIGRSSNLVLLKDDKTSSSFHGFFDSARFLYQLKIKKEDSAIIKGSFAWLGKQSDEFPSGEEKFEVTVAPEKASISNVTVTTHKPKTWMGFFWIGLLAGLIAVFMPCLYPLFPVTVNYFMHHYGGRRQGLKNALLYSLFIILIYGIPATLLTLAILLYIRYQ